MFAGGEAVAALAPGPTAGARDTMLLPDRFAVVARGIVGATGCGGSAGTPGCRCETATRACVAPLFSLRPPGPRAACPVFTFSAHRLLLQPHGFEGLLLEPKSPSARSSHLGTRIRAHRNVYLDATRPCPHIDLAPREYPLAEVEKLVVDLELLEDLLGVSEELLVCPRSRDTPPRSRIAAAGTRHRVKDRAKLRLVDRPRRSESERHDARSPRSPATSPTPPAPRL